MQANIHSAGLSGERSGEPQIDTLIVGGGVIGLALARSIAQRHPRRSIAVIEKEPEVAAHASSRNSGVLHAGFYYSSDSLKAKLTATGNKLMREFCRKHGIPVLECGKLVVARDGRELAQLEVLCQRGKANGSQVELISEDRAREIAPEVVTYGKALYSPLTASVDPLRVCLALKEELKNLGVRIYTGMRYLGGVRTPHGLDVSVRSEAGGNARLSCRYLINAAGLYADEIAHGLGFGLGYEIVPFKGKYIEYQGEPSALRTNVYPVPDLRNPFLGVHFTKKNDGKIKIGPTATPAFWREHYHGLHGFNLREFVSIVWMQLRMLITNANNFRQIAIEELKKLNRMVLIRSALPLVRGFSEQAFGTYGKPGIRAQLIDRKTLKLVQDFMLEGDHTSLHVLNAISPGFTCSLAFAEYVVENYYEKFRGRAHEVDMSGHGGSSAEVGPERTQSP